VGVTSPTSNLNKACRMASEKVGGRAMLLVLDEIEEL
jgi:hypothetical protein